MLCRCARAVLLATWPLLLAATSPVGAQGSFVAAVSGPDVVFTYTSGGGGGQQPSFLYTLGAGGAISQIEWNGQDLIGPAITLNVTDRVVQLVTWDLGNCSPPVQAGDTCSAAPGSQNQPWNVNQAGTRGDGTSAHPSILAGTVSVTIAPGNQQVDVYSVSDRQWLWQLESGSGTTFRGRIAMLTRYGLGQDGALLIQRFAYMGDIYAAGPDVNSYRPIGWQRPVHQHWLPFVAGGSAFEAVVLQFQGCTPTRPTPSVTVDLTTFSWPSSAARNIPAIYSCGYAVAQTGTAARPFVAIVFGTQQASAPCSGCTWNLGLLGSGAPNNVLEVTPQLYVNAAQRGLTTRMLVLSEVYLYPGVGLDAATQAVIAGYAQRVAPPSVLDPHQAFTGDLAAIVATLRTNMEMPLTADMRVAHLASRVTTGR